MYLNGFFQVVICAGIERVVALFRAGGDQDDGSVFGGRLSAQVAAEFQAVHVGHMPVDDEKVYAPVIVFDDRFAAGRALSTTSSVEQ